MSRVLPVDVRGQVNRLRRAMVAAGIISSVTGLSLEWGSKTNGNAFELWISSPGNRHEYRPFGTLHFGFTARDCIRTLEALTIGLEEGNEAWKKRLTTPSAPTGSQTSTGGTTFRQEYPDATSAD
jgi:hypothetical protein